MLKITEAIAAFNRKRKPGEERMTQKKLSLLVVPTKKGESESGSHRRKEAYLSRLVRYKMRSCDFEIILLIASHLKVDTNYLLGWFEWKEEYTKQIKKAEKQHIN